MGLVVNRPTDVSIDEALSETEATSAYSGNLYWGGPVQMASLRALMLTESPPENAEQVTASVYMVPVEAALTGSSTDPDKLRIFLGYAGWAPGQLDGEMARGSWHVVPATEESVFAEDPGALWDKLAPSQNFRAFAPPHFPIETSHGPGSE